MSTKQELDHDDQQERHERDGRDARIRQQVVHSLGLPPGLHSVQVRVLWGGYYRVNVLLGADAASARIVHSYFVQADATGNIIGSTPKIGVAKKDPT
jgi:hypothetical protein